MLSNHSARRTWTDAQLAQKRQHDRSTQRRTRAETKQRLERIENDISCLRGNIEELLTFFYGKAPAPRAVEYCVTPGNIQTWIGPGAPANGVFPFCSNHTDARGRLASHQLLLALLSSRQASSASASDSTLACHCGVKHQDGSSCLELSSFTMLYHAHTALQRNLQFGISVPRNPAPGDYLSDVADENPVSFVLGSSLKQFEMVNIETFCACYFLAYRLLRWRLYPSIETLKDVPEILRPTAVQNTTPHAVCVDLMPWPDFRDYLCLNQPRQDRQHSVYLYLKSIRLQWPADEKLLTRRQDGQTVLNDNFEAIVTDLNNWRMGSPWAETFPDLLKYVGG